LCCSDSHQALSTALAALSQALARHRLAQAAAWQTSAPLFSPFAYVRKGEYGISMVIRDLLDPNGAHSQGPRFLNLFLDRFGFHALQPVSAQAHVATESPTAEGRRIDIVIRDRTWILGIENKPWARDGELQIADYLKEIHSIGCTRAHFIYLTTCGHRPSVTSINQEDCDSALARGELTLASYQDILAWLDACYDDCRAERVQLFLSDFRNHLREEVMNVRNREPNNPVVDSVLAEDTRKHLQVALQIAQQSDAIHEALLDMLRTGLRERLPGWEITGTPMKADEGLALVPPSAKDWFFCVELDSGSRKWFYGLKRSEPDDHRSTAMRALADRLRKRFRGSDGPNHHWLMWLWFDNRTVHDPSSYSQWEDNVQSWADMADGTMTTNIAALATELRDAAIELG
jgi:hypothetical protein